MDIFSHGLWTAAVYKGTNDFALKPKQKKPLKIWRAAFWGVFPDFFSFTIPFIWISAGLALGKISVSDLPSFETLEPLVSTKLNGVLELSKSLYNLSHSFIVFAAIFGILYLIFRRPFWELGGWFMHILIDIPSHSYQFYPTPFLWPVSGFKFDGIAWGNGWFMVVDFSLLLLIWGFFLFKKLKNRNN